MISPPLRGQFLPGRCRQMQSAHLDLAQIAREAGGKVVYLGTYQPLPAAFVALVKAEGQLSELMGAQYAQISERMREGRQHRPDLRWFAQDGMHPGMATTALMTIAVYEAATGQQPMVRELCVAPSSFRSIDGTAVLALHPPPEGNAPRQCVLDTSAMRDLTHLVRSGE